MVWSNPGFANQLPAAGAARGEVFVLPMIRSMTGYGHGAADGPGVRVVVDVRSVNNRFADLRLRLPDSAAALEPDVRRKILGRIRRGRVEVDFTLERAPGVAATTVNRPLVDDFVAAARELSRDYGIPGALDLTAILRMPGVVQPGGAARDLDEGGRIALEAALDLALEAHDSERCREGEALRADLIERFVRMEALVEAVAARAAEVPAAARRKLEERLQALRGRYPDFAGELDASQPYLYALQTEMCAHLDLSPTELFDRLRKLLLS
jgi:uncharacterized protein (TIGR00255 family)